MTHFPPCSESLDELVLEPEPDELESSSSESSELELLLALSRDDLDSRLEVGRPLDPEGITNEQAIIKGDREKREKTLREGWGVDIIVPFFDFSFDFPNFPLTSCSRFSSSAFFLAVSAAGLLDFCTVGKKINKKYLSIVQ